MSFTYNANITTSIDKVRFNVGDNVDTGHILENEEINFLVNEYMDINIASAHAAEQIATHYANKVDESLGDHSKTYSQLQDHYTMMASKLRTRNAKAATPYVGGKDTEAVFTGIKP